MKACGQKLYRLTDMGNAERLVDQHGESIRFCRDLRQWYAWDGTRWVHDDGMVLQLAKKTVRAMQLEYKELLAAPDEDDILRRSANALAAWALRSERASSLSAMVRLAESDPAITILSAELDPDPWALSVANGTLNLSNGEFRGHLPADLISMTAPVSFEQDAHCPHWIRFLSEVFQPNLEVVPFLQRAVGYTLTGSTREECVFVLLGLGRNGKSTLVSILQDLLGAYAGVADITSFLDTRRSGPQEDITDLRGRRFVSAQEPDPKGRFATSTVKWLSGGDKIRARRLYEHAQEFPPTHKIWLCVNRLPAAARDDFAFWHRLKVIPFDVSFRGRENVTLKFTLRRELSGILNWAIDGCLAWQRYGLDIPESVVQATETCRANMAMV